MPEQVPQGQLEQLQQQVAMGKLLTPQLYSTVYSSSLAERESSRQQTVPTMQKGQSKPVKISGDPSQRMIKATPPKRMLDTTAYNKQFYDRMYANQQNKAQSGQAPPPDTPSYDFSSIDHYNNSQKVDFLQRPDFNPEKLKDPYDQLNAQLYRWQRIAQNVIKGKADGTSYTDEEKKVIASQAWQRMIAPAYKRMGDEGISHDLWMKEAYNTAQNFNLKGNYRGSLYNGLMAGITSVAQDASHIWDTAGTALGVFLSPSKEITDENWASQLAYTKSQVAKPVGFWDQARALAKTNGYFDYEKF